MDSAFNCYHSFKILNGFNDPLTIKTGSSYNWYIGILSYFFLNHLHLHLHFLFLFYNFYLFYYISI